MFNRHLEIRMDDYETAITMACHPRVMKEIFIDNTAIFDYNIHVVIDGRELKNLSLDVDYDGYYTTFYFKDVDDINIGSRIEITLVFWYKENIVREFNGSINVRRDEMSQATEHWTYMEDEQFHIDPEDVDPTSFLQMLKPEWSITHDKRVETEKKDDEIIDVEYTEVHDDEALWLTMNEMC